MKVKNVLKSSEIEIIKRLGDEVYTVEFFDGYFSSETAEKNKEQDCQAAGFFRAVQKAAEADLHIFPKAYVCMFNSVGNTADKFAALLESLKISMNNAEDLFILSGEESESGNLK